MLLLPLFDADIWFWWIGAVCCQYTHIRCLAIMPYDIAGAASAAAMLHLMAPCWCLMRYCRCCRWYADIFITPPLMLLPPLFAIDCCLSIFFAASSFAIAITPCCRRHYYAFFADIAYADAVRCCWYCCAIFMLLHYCRCFRHAAAMIRWYINIRICYYFSFALSDVAADAAYVIFDAQSSLAEMSPCRFCRHVDTYAWCRWCRCRYMPPMLLFRWYFRYAIFAVYAAISLLLLDAAELTLLPITDLLPPPSMLICCAYMMPPLICW